VDKIGSELFTNRRTPARRVTETFGEPDSSRVVAMFPGHPVGLQPLEMAGLPKYDPAHSEARRI
jgi:hypothetical protein